MKKVLLRAPLLTSSGYGVHSRQVFEALLEREDIDLYVRPTEWGSSSWDISNPLVDKIKEFCIKNHWGVFDESYQVCMPNEFEKLGKTNIGVTAGFESNFVKKSWLEKFEMMDTIVVPSEFTKAAIANTFIKTNGNIPVNIKVINEWYLNSFDEINFKGHFLNLNFKKNMLIFGQLTSADSFLDRKNILKTIKCCLDFCIDNKEVGLILKTNLGNNSSKNRENLFLFLRENFSEKELKKIAVISSDIPESVLVRLFNDEKVSCLVSGTRGEGWGLPILYSAAAGLPIIATDYSSYKEFLDEDFLKVDYDLISIDKKSIFTDDFNDFLWAEFNSNSMFNCIENFFNKETKYIDISERRKKIIKQKFCKNKIIKNYKDLFENLN